MNTPRVSIIIRSFNEAWALEHTLKAVQEQNYTNWELIVIDSGSTDGSVELIQKAKPQHFVQIQPHEYNPSRVMNRGMALSSTDFGIFINADATPQNDNWLRPLVETLLSDQDIAAVFGRQIPRPDCKAVFAHDYDRCFGPKRESARWEHFFSMASSGIRKEIWARRGFNERMQYSEDDEYTRWCRSSGYRVVYVPESIAMHSHNYSPEQARRRSYGEGKALAAVWAGEENNFDWFRTVPMGWMNDACRDLVFCSKRNRLHQWPHALRIRWQQRLGRWAGFQDGWKTYRQNSENEVLPPVWAQCSRPA